MQRTLQIETLTFKEKQIMDMKQIGRKSIFYAFAVVLIALCISGCSNESIDGDWDPMEWQKVVTEKVKVNGVSCYHIPARGGICQFKCKNYGSFWISWRHL